MRPFLCEANILENVTSPAGLKVLSLFLYKEYKLFMLSPVVMQGLPLGSTQHTASTLLGALAKQLLPGGCGATAAMADATPTPTSFPAGPQKEAQGGNSSPGQLAVFSSCPHTRKYRN